jgi:hypothetical protein
MDRPGLPPKRLLLGALQRRHGLAHPMNRRIRGGWLLLKPRGLIWTKPSPRLRKSAQFSIYMDWRGAANRPAAAPSGLADASISKRMNHAIRRGKSASTRSMRCSTLDLDVPPKWANVDRSSSLWALRLLLLVSFLRRPSFG